MGASKDRIAILVGPRGRGANMLAIAEACREGRIPAEVAMVVSPKADTPAVEIARSEDLCVRVVPPEPLETYGGRLLQELKDADADWVVLAGYTRLLPAQVLAAYPNRVLNIHPALLPKYGGQGMYGMRVHEAVIAAGDVESGCTVHWVTEAYDEGDIVHQRRCPVEPGDTPESLAARVLEQERLAYAEALAKVIGERGI